MESKTRISWNGIRNTINNYWLTLLKTVVLMAFDDHKITLTIFYYVLLYDLLVYVLTTSISFFIQMMYRYSLDQQTENFLESSFKGPNKTFPKHIRHLSCKQYCQCKFCKKKFKRQIRWPMQWLILSYLIFMNSMA